MSEEASFQIYIGEGTHKFPKAQGKVGRKGKNKRWPIYCGPEQVGGYHCQVPRWRKPGESKLEVWPRMEPWDISDFRDWRGAMEPQRKRKVASEETGRQNPVVSWNVKEESQHQVLTLPFRISQTHSGFQSELGLHFDPIPVRTSQGSPLFIGAGTKGCVICR